MNDAIKEQLIAARKNQILDAATTVFAEKGFHSTTIRDIASHAGIADGTIYNYFENKPALLLGVFERMRATIVPEEAPPPSPEIDIRILLKMALSYPLSAMQDDGFALFRVIMSEMLVNDDLKALYYEKILTPSLHGAEALLYNHAARFNIDPERISLTVRTISALIMGLTMEYIMGDPVLADKWADMPDFLTDLILDGIITKD